MIRLPYRRMVLHRLRHPLHRLIRATSDDRAYYCRSCAIIANSRKGQ